VPLGRTFALSIGNRYQQLVPDAGIVSPNKIPVLRGYEGWAYRQVGGARLYSVYRAPEVFDRREGAGEASHPAPGAFDCR